MTAGDGYDRLMRSLAEVQAARQEQMDEVGRWHERQLAAADRALREARQFAREAAAEVDAAAHEVAYVDTESAALWRTLAGRIGPRGARLGEPPAPGRGPVPPDTEPENLLAGVRGLLEQAKRRRPLSGPAYALFALLGAGCAGAAAVAAFGLRAAGHRTGGDLGVALPVVGLIVTLLGPFLGLLPAKGYADRRGAALDPGGVAAVLVAGLMTVGVLAIALR